MKIQKGEKPDDRLDEELNNAKEGGAAIKKEEQDDAE